MKCPAQSHNSIDDNEFVVYSRVRPASHQLRTNMRPTVGRWVSGEDSFDREGELRVLESHVRGRNHLLLTGQRRMGKTSIARELGRRLEGQYEELVSDIRGRVADAIEILVHDGYIEESENGHRFPSRLLRDWWAARFRDHHVPLESRCPDPTTVD